MTQTFLEKSLWKITNAVNRFGLVDGEVLHIFNALLYYTCECAWGLQLFDSAHFQTKIKY